MCLVHNSRALPIAGQQERYCHIIVFNTYNLTCSQLNNCYSLISDFSAPGKNFFIRCLQQTLSRQYLKYSCTHLPVQVPSTSVKSFCFTVFRRFGPKYRGCSRISCSREICKQKSTYVPRHAEMVSKHLFPRHKQDN